MKQILAAQYDPKDASQGVTFIVGTGQTQQAMTEAGDPVKDKGGNSVMVPVTENVHFGQPTNLVVEDVDAWVESCRGELERLLKAGAV